MGDCASILNDRRFCLDCVNAKKKDGTPFECSICLLWKSGVSFGKGVEHTREDSGSGELDLSCFTRV